MDKRARGERHDEEEARVIRARIQLAGKRDTEAQGGGFDDAAAATAAAPTATTSSTPVNKKT